MSRTREAESLREEIMLHVAHDLNEQMAQYHEAIAERLGLTTADHKVFDLICKTGPLTAGQLAQLTNLTTGAVTGLVDRLAAAGVVRRERDPHDRRKVIIQPSTNVDSLAAIMASLSDALTELCTRYSDQELRTILDFTQHLVAVLQAETAKLQQNNADV